MKISFIGTKGMNIPGISFGGFETVISELGPRFVENGDEVYIYCRSKFYKGLSKLPRQYKGVNLKYFPSIETKNLGTMSHAIFCIADSILNNVELIFLFNLGPGIFLPIIKLFNIRVITNLDGVEWERSKWSKLAKFMFLLGASFNIRYANYLIADAEEIRKIYCKKFNKGSIVIPYGSEIRNDLSDDYIKSVNLIPNKYFLVATRFIPENNPLFIIENYLFSESNYPLVVLGKNYYKSKYENKIKSITDKRVIFLGHIADRKTLMELYRYSYVYIHGHSVGGTNPTMLEAMANSCCILALNTVFNREMLSDDEYGLYFMLDKEDYIDKINYLITNPDIVEFYKKKSKDKILSYYNWDIVIRKYCSIINKLR